MSTPSQPADLHVNLSTRDWIIVIAIGLLACLPLYIYGVPFVGDLPHHYRTALGFYESIVSGNYYPSWHPSTNGGYGDPSVRFYPPALYFLMCGSRLITRDWFLAGLLTATLLTTTGALGMYFWARCFTTHQYALAAGLLFLFSPFHANEMYQAGMYGQYAAANVLPFVFAFVERIIQGRGSRSGGSSADVAGLGLSYGLVILFHVPLAVLGSISLALYALIRLVQSFKIGSIYRLVAGVMLGVALSCFYWLPVMRELKWKYPSGAGQGEWFNYKNNFLFQQSPSVMSDFLLPMLVGATLVLAAPIAILIFKKDKVALAPGAVAVVSFLMATPLSKPIWDALPVLQETQFPWRWMTITSACLSLLVTVSLAHLYAMRRSRWRPIALALIGFVVIALSFTILQLVRGAFMFDRATFNQKVESEKGAETNQDFLPVWAHGKLRSMKAVVEAPDRSVTVLDWSAEHKVFALEAGHETEARLKIYYYPLWLASVNGKPLTTRPAEDGALLIAVPAEKATIEVSFTEPRSSYIAAIVSVCALAVIVGLWVFSIRNSRRIASSA